MNKVDVREAEGDGRSCACHPDDRPPVCQREFSTTHCRLAYAEKQLEEAKQIIRESQSILTCYLPPDSGITQQQCISDLLDILDGQRARSFLKENSNG